MRDERLPAVYIMANRYRGTMYVGVTSALWNRVANHKNEAFDGFTKRYGLKTLVYYEHHATMEEAIRREKQLKKWNRARKFRIIEAMNPDWLDLHELIDGSAMHAAPEAGPPPSRG
jgi:putative endonuclease